MRSWHRFTGPAGWWIVLTALAVANAPMADTRADAPPAAVGRGPTALPLPSPTWEDHRSPVADDPDTTTGRDDSDTTGDGQQRDGPLSLRRGATGPLVTILSSLGLVLGLFLALVWVSRKTQHPAGGQTIPDEALRVLGRKPIPGGGSLALVRCGRSLLLLGISAGGMQRLAQIDDEAETRHLEALCSGSSSQSFRQTLDEMQREQPGDGFVGQGVEQPPPRRRLFN